MSNKKMPDNQSSYQSTIEEALQPLRDLNEHGFGYGTGIPLPVQSYLLTINRALLTILEVHLEFINQGSPTTTKEEAK